MIQQSQIKTPESPLPPLALGIREAAKSICTSPSALYALMKSGRLAYVKIGKRRLIPVSALEELLQANIHIDTPDAEIGDSAAKKRA